jgi:hypothetical protein
VDLTRWGQGPFKRRWGAASGLSRLQRAQGAEGGVRRGRQLRRRPHACGGGRRNSSKTPSHNRSGSRSPALASSMILLAITWLARSPRSASRSAISAISNARPMTRIVSGSNLWPSRWAELAWKASKQNSVPALELIVHFLGTLSVRSPTNDSADGVCSSETEQETTRKWQWPSAPPGWRPF